MQKNLQPYDALLVLSFGGPEGPPDVIPFLENVLRGRNVPRERMMEVAEHYYHFGGRSPINDQNRALISALRELLAAEGPRLPVYWGNRNWHPFLKDALREMAGDGVRRALVYVTSAFSSYSACRQYLEDMERARAEAGADAPELVKLRLFFNHPGFLEAMAARVREALEALPGGQRDEVTILFTAHSIPLSMAAGCAYVQQLEEACLLVSKMVIHSRYRLVYQSRSGPPTQPWLEPDVLDALKLLRQEGATAVVIAPIGFTSDHMEVLYDLDTEAKALCDEIGLQMVRAGTVGTHPRFVRMIRELILERMGEAPKRWLGELGPAPDVCPATCCPPPARPLRPEQRPA